MKYKLALGILIMYSFGIASPAFAILAVSPKPGETYRVHIELNQEDLPTGVRFIENVDTVKTDSPYRLSTACIYGFVNETDKPFYLIYPDTFQSHDPAISGIPEQYWPLKQFVSEQTYEYQHFTQKEGWRLIGPSTENFRSFTLTDLGRMGDPIFKNAYVWECSFVSLFKKKDPIDKAHDEWALRSKHNIQVMAYYEGKQRSIRGTMWFSRYDTRNISEKTKDWFFTYAPELTYFIQIKYAFEIKLIIFIGVMFSGYYLIRQRKRNRLNKILDKS